MSEIKENTMSSVTKRNLEAYIKTHDVQYIAEDAIFINLATGERTEGRLAIAEMLHHIYHVAFDAKAEVKNIIVTEDSAMIEADFTGTHIGEFAGIPPTDKKVKVPLCVTYKLENGLITEARIYMLVNVLFDQLKN